jgi:hypothetical protein
MSNAVFLLSTFNDHILCKFLDPVYVFRGFRRYNLKKFLSLFSEGGLLVNEYLVCGLWWIQHSCRKFSGLLLQIYFKEE